MTLVPRVSIITPSYNRAHLISATLESVRAQTFGDWEAIVVDDHSQDNTVEVVRKFCEIDDRIRISSRQRPHKGANVCRNEGLSMARGEFVVFLDSDDLLSPSCLEHRVTKMDRSPHCQFGVYLTELFSERIGDRAVLWNVFNETNDLFRLLSLDVVWCTMGPIWRREALERLGGFDETLPSFQDWALHTQALIAGMEYYRDSTVDNFCRHKHTSSDQISSVSITRPDHLESHQRLFIKTYESVAAAGLLRGEVQERLTGLFWWLARSWLGGGNPAKAAQVWRTVIELKLCGRRPYLEGAFIIKYLSKRSGGRIARTIQRGWPKAYRHFGSETLFHAPATPPPELAFASRSTTAPLKQQSPK